MKLVERFRKLCTPSALYFVLSSLALVIIAVQNMRDPTRFCMGIYECPAPGSNNGLVFAVEAVYIVFWTWVLNLICNAGYTSISWFLVLFPIVLMFILLGIMIMEMNKTKEGMRSDEEGSLEEGSLEEGSSKEGSSEEGSLENGIIETGLLKGGSLEGFGCSKQDEGFKGKGSGSGSGSGLEGYSGSDNYTPY